MNLKKPHIRFISSILVVSFLATSVDLSLAEEVYRDAHRSTLAPTSRFNSILEHGLGDLAIEGPRHETRKFLERFEKDVAFRYLANRVWWAFDKNLTGDGLKSLLESDGADRFVGFDIQTIVKAESGRIFSINYTDPATGTLYKFSYRRADDPYVVSDLQACTIDLSDGKVLGLQVRDKDDRTLEEHFEAIAQSARRWVWGKNVQLYCDRRPGVPAAATEAYAPEWAVSSRATEDDKWFLKSLWAQLLVADEKERMSESEAMRVLVKRLNADFSLSLQLDESVDLKDAKVRQKVLADIFSKGLPPRPDVYLKPYIILLGYVSKKPDDFIRAVYEATVGQRPKDAISTVGKYSISEPVDAAVQYHLRELLYQGERPLYHREQGFSHREEEAEVRWSEDKEAKEKIAKALAIIEAKAHPGWVRRAWNRAWAIMSEIMAWMIGAANVVFRRAGWGIMPIKRREAEEGRVEKVRQIWEDILPSLSVVSLYGAHTVYADPDDMLVRAFHAGRRRHVMYIPAHFLAEMDLHNPSDMNELAEYIYHVMYWFAVYEREKDELVRSRLNEEGAALTRIDGRLGLVAADAIRARFHRLMEESTFGMCRSIRAMIAGYSGHAGWLDAIKKNAMQGDASAWGRAMLFLNEARRIYLKDAYFYELLGATETALDFYDKAHRAARLLQSCEAENPIEPIKIQERLVIFYLKRGMFDEFLRELATMLTGRGYPDIMLKPGSKYIEPAVARQDLLASMFAYADSRITSDRFAREIAYTLGYFASIHPDPAYRTMLENVRAQAAAIIETFAHERRGWAAEHTDIERIRAAESSGDLAAQEALLKIYSDQMSAFELLGGVNDTDLEIAEKIRDIYTAAVHVYSLPLTRHRVRERKHILANFFLYHIHPPELKKGRPDVRADEARRALLYNIAASPDGDIWRPALEAIIEMMAKDKSDTKTFHRCYYPLLVEVAKAGGLAQAMVDLLIRASRGEIELFSVKENDVGDVQGQEGEEKEVQKRFCAYVKELVYELVAERDLPSLRGYFLRDLDAALAQDASLEPLCKEMRAMLNAMGGDADAPSAGPSIVHSIVPIGLGAFLLMSLTGCAGNGTAGAVLGAAIGAAIGILTAGVLYVRALRRAIGPVSAPAAGARMNAKNAAKAGRIRSQTRRDFLKISAALCPGGAIAGAAIAAGIARLVPTDRPTPPPREDALPDAETIRAAIRERLRQSRNFAPEIEKMAIPDGFRIARYDLTEAMQYFEQFLSVCAIEIFHRRTPADPLFSLDDTISRKKLWISAQACANLMRGDDLIIFQEIMHLNPVHRRDVVEAMRIQQEILANSQAVDMPGGGQGVLFRADDPRMAERYRAALRIMWRAEIEAHYLEMAAYEARARTQKTDLAAYLRRLAESGGSAHVFETQRQLAGMFIAGRISPEFEDLICDGVIASSAKVFERGMLAVLAAIEFGNDYSIDRVLRDPRTPAAEKRRFFDWVHRTILHPADAPSVASAALLSAAGMNEIRLADVPDSLNARRFRGLIDIARKIFSSNDTASGIAKTLSVIKDDEGNTIFNYIDHVNKLIGLLEKSNIVFMNRKDPLTGNILPGVRIIKGSAVMSDVDESAGTIYLSLPIFETLVINMEKELSKSRSAEDKKMRFALAYVLEAAAILAKTQDKDFPPPVLFSRLLCDTRDMLIGEVEDIYAQNTDHLCGARAEVCKRMFADPDHVDIQLLHKALLCLDSEDMLPKVMQDALLASGRMTNFVKVLQEAAGGTFDDQVPGMRELAGRVQDSYILKTRTLLEGADMIWTVASLYYTFPHEAIFACIVMRLKDAGCASCEEFARALRKISPEASKLFFSTLQNAEKIYAPDPAYKEIIDAVRIVRENFVDESIKAIEKCDINGANSHTNISDMFLMYPNDKALRKLLEIYNVSDIEYSHVYWAFRRIDEEMGGDDLLDMLDPIAKDTEDALSDRAAWVRYELLTARVDKEMRYGYCAEHKLESLDRTMISYLDMCVRLGRHYAGIRAIRQYAEVLGASNSNRLDPVCIQKTSVLSLYEARLLYMLGEELFQSERYREAERVFRNSLIALNFYQMRFSDASGLVTRLEAQLAGRLEECIRRLGRGDLPGGSASGLALKKLLAVMTSAAVAAVFAAVFVGAYFASHQVNAPPETVNITSTTSVSATNPAAVPAVSENLSRPTLPASDPGKKEPLLVDVPDHEPLSAQDFMIQRAGSDTKTYIYNPETEESVTSTHRNGVLHMLRRQDPTSETITMYDENGLIQDETRYIKVESEDGHRSTYLDRITKYNGGEIANVIQYEQDDNGFARESSVITYNDDGTKTIARWNWGDSTTTVLDEEGGATRIENVAIVSDGNNDVVNAVESRIYESGDGFAVETTETWTSLTVDMREHVDIDLLDGSVRIRMANGEELEPMMPGDPGYEDKLAEVVGCLRGAGFDDIAVRLEDGSIFETALLRKSSDTPDVPGSAENAQGLNTPSMEGAALLPFISGLDAHSLLFGHSQAASIGPAYGAANIVLAVVCLIGMYLIFNRRKLFMSQEHETLFFTRSAFGKEGDDTRARRISSSKALFNGSVPDEQDGISFPERTISRHILSYYGIRYLVADVLRCAHVMLVPQREGYFFSKIDMVYEGSRIATLDPKKREVSYLFIPKRVDKNGDIEYEGRKYRVGFSGVQGTRLSGKEVALIPYNGDDWSKGFRVLYRGRIIAQIHTAKGMSSAVPNIKFTAADLHAIADNYGVGFPDIERIWMNQFSLYRDHEIRQRILNIARMSWDGMSQASIAKDVGSAPFTRAGVSLDLNTLGRVVMTELEADNIRKIIAESMRAAPISRQDALRLLADPKIRSMITRPALTERFLQGLKESQWNTIVRRLIKERHVWKNRAAKLPIGVVPEKTYALRLRSPAPLEKRVRGGVYMQERSRRFIEDLRQVIEDLRKKNIPMTRKGIAEHMGMPYITFRWYVKRLKLQGVVRKAVSSYADRNILAAISKNAADGVVESRGSIVKSAGIGIRTLAKRIKANPAVRIAVDKAIQNSKKLDKRRMIKSYEHNMRVMVNYLRAKVLTDKRYDHVSVVMARDYCMSIPGVRHPREMMKFLEKCSEGKWRTLIRRMDRAKKLRIKVRTRPRKRGTLAAVIKEAADAAAAGTGSSIALGESTNVPSVSPSPAEAEALSSDAGQIRAEELLESRIYELEQALLTNPIIDDDQTALRPVIHNDVLQAVEKCGLDTRPIESGLMGIGFVGHDMAVREVVNPDHTDKVALYGGSGADLSDVLLSLDANINYFVDTAPVDPALLRMLTTPREWNACDPDRDLESLALPYVGYAQNKRFNGFAFASERMANIERRLIHELKCMGVDRSSVTVTEAPDGTVVIGFIWAYPGMPPRPYSVTFIQADIAEPTLYPKPLSAVLNAGIDIYYQRAARDIPSMYMSFLPFIASYVRKGGFLVTDDHTMYDETAASQDPDNLLKMRKIQFTGRDEKRSRKMKAWQNFLQAVCRNEYGWLVCIRQKMDEAAQATVALPDVRGGGCIESKGLSDEKRVEIFAAIRNSARPLNTGELNQITNALRSCLDCETLAPDVKAVVSEKLESILKGLSGGSIKVFPASTGVRAPTEYVLVMADDSSIYLMDDIFCSGFFNGMYTLQAKILFFEILTRVEYENFHNKHIRDYLEAVLWHQMMESDGLLGTAIRFYMYETFSATKTELKDTSNPLIDRLILAGAIQGHGGPLDFSTARRLVVNPLNILDVRKDVPYSFSRFDLETIRNEMRIPDSLIDILGRFSFNIGKAPAFYDRNDMLIKDCNDKYKYVFMAMECALQRYIAIIEPKLDGISDDEEQFKQHAKTGLFYAHLLIAQVRAINSLLGHGGEAPIDIGDWMQRPELEWLVKVEGGDGVIKKIGVTYDIDGSSQGLEVKMSPELFKLALERILENGFCKGASDGEMIIRVERSVEPGRVTVKVFTPGSIDNKACDFNPRWGLQELFTLNYDRQRFDRTIGMPFTGQAILSMGGKIRVDNVARNGKEYVLFTIDLPEAVKNSSGGLTARASLASDSDTAPAGASGDATQYSPGPEKAVPGLLDPKEEARWGDEAASSLKVWAATRHGRHSIVALETAGWTPETQANQLQQVMNTFALKERLQRALDEAGFASVHIVTGKGAELAGEIYKAQDEFKVAAEDIAVLGSEATLTDERAFGGLWNKAKLVGVDPRDILKELNLPDMRIYVRLFEMLTMALEIAVSDDDRRNATIDRLRAAHPDISIDDQRRLAQGIILFIPHAAEVPANDLPKLYRNQIEALLNA